MKKKIVVTSIITVIAGFSLVPVVLADNQDFPVKKIDASERADSGNIIADDHHATDNSLKKSEKKARWGYKFGKRDNDNHHRDHAGKRDSHSSGKGHSSHSKGHSGSHKSAHKGNHKSNHGGGHMSGHKGNHKNSHGGGHKGNHKGGHKSSHGGGHKGGHKGGHH